MTSTPSVPVAPLRALIAQAQELLEGITPGEWVIKYETNVFGDHSLGGKRLVANTGGYSSNVTDEVTVNARNAAFIAAAPRLIRQMLQLLLDGLPGGQQTEEAQEKEQR